MTGVLESLTGAQWRLLESHGETLRLAAGDVVIAEGQVEEAFYVVLGGVLSVVARGAVDDAVLGRIRAGALFGEVGFFDGAPRTATVRAEVPSSVLRVSRRAFDQLRAHDADLATDLVLELARTVARNFRDLIARGRQAPRQPDQPLPRALGAQPAGHAPADRPPSAQPAGVDGARRQR